MAKYKVVIEETVSNTFIVESESAEAARKITEEKYKNCEIVLEPGNLISKRMAILSPNANCVEWSEF